MSPMNPHLAVRYHWQAGSMPPPAHYEYTIRLAPDGAGEITFYPDYPQHNPPVWSETFTPAAETLSRLHPLIAKKKIMTKKWRPPARSPVGGSLEFLEVITADKQVSVPSRLNAKDAAALREVFDAIRALVPQEMWDRLLARRQAFEDDYSARQRP